MEQNPRETFEENIRHYRESFELLGSRHAMLSWLRVFVFLAFTILTVYLLYLREFIYGGLFLVVGMFLFGLIVNFHKALSFRRRQQQLLGEVNQEEIKRLDHELSSFYQGTEFIDDEHPFTSDLDVFGRNSLFQLLNRTATPSGKGKLATWLKEPTSVKVIKERQEAVKELSGKVEWRQNLECFSRHFLEGFDHRKLEGFREWLSDTDRPVTGSKYMMSIAIGLLNVAILVGVIIGSLRVEFLFLSASLGVLMIRSLQVSIQEAAEISFHGVRLLRSYGQMINWVNQESFDSSFVEQRKLIFEGNQSAVGEIRALGRLMEFLNNRGNMLYWMFNSMFLIDIHLAVGIHKWKQRNVRNIDQWIEALSEIEAISGMAGFGHANPQYTVPLPLVEEDNHQFQSKRLGHPLIPDSKRVLNDFGIDESHRIGIITGSNMSGKSTFLRTVGVNLVLAHLGAPVCAAEMTFSKVDIFTSMRTSDNLEASVSSFYAELRRLEVLLGMVEAQKPVLFLLDEILKGTNTHDRQLGARSLIKQLNRNKVLGLVSTHDIALGDLAEREEHLVNLNFSSEVVNGELLFDYKLREGVCKSFNASELMARIGIKLDE